MGTIKTTNIETITGSGTLTLGQSGETISIPTNTTLGASGTTITVPSGATLTVPSGGLSGQNYPAFFAHLSSDQSVANQSATKVQFDSELFDTDNCYDNTTNYRFTPNVAGKYLLTAGTTFSALNDQKQTILYFYKNGTNVGFLRNINAKTTGNLSITYTIIVDANGTSDYFEVFAYQDNGNSRNLQGNSGSLNYFGAYRIGS